MVINNSERLPSSIFRVVQEVHFSWNTVNIAAITNLNGVVETHGHIQHNIRNTANCPGLLYCYWILPRNNGMGSEWKQFCYNQADSKLWHWHRIQYHTVRPHNLDYTSNKQMRERMREIKGFRIQYGFTVGTTASNDTVCYEEVWDENRVFCWRGGRWPQADSFQWLSINSGGPGGLAV